MEWALHFINATSLIRHHYYQNVFILPLIWELQPYLTPPLLHLTDFSSVPFPLLLILQSVPLRDKIINSFSCLTQNNFPLDSHSARIHPPWRSGHERCTILREYIFTKFLLRGILVLLGWQNRIFHIVCYMAADSVLTSSLLSPASWIKCQKPKRWLHL